MATESPRTATPITIGAKTISIGLLKMKDLRQLNPQLQLVLSSRPGAIPTPEELTAMIDVVYQSAKSNDPSFTMSYDEFTALIDELDYDAGCTCIAKAFEACSVRSGLIKTAGEAAPGEEASPAAN